MLCKILEGKRMKLFFIIYFIINEFITKYHQNVDKSTLLLVSLRLNIRLRYLVRYFWLVSPKHFNNSCSTFLHRKLMASRLTAVCDSRHRDVKTSRKVLRTLTRTDSSLFLRGLRSTSFLPVFYYMIF